MNMTIEEYNNIRNRELVDECLEMLETLYYRKKQLDKDTFNFYTARTKTNAAKVETSQTQMEYSWHSVEGMIQNIREHKYNE